MILQQLNSGSCRSYLVASERTREAVIVDPVLGEVDNYLKTIREQELKLRWVIDTHTHRHHASGGALLKEKAGVAYLMHFNSEAACVSKRLRERDAIGLGELTLTFIHAPGHTSDSIIIQLPGCLLTGDFLLLGTDGSGRLDLPGADVFSHYKSLLKLAELPEDWAVYPAHDVAGRGRSTLKQERAANPVLKRRSWDEYAHWWASLRLPPAPWAETVLQANVACSKDAVEVPRDADIGISSALSAEVQKQARSAVPS